MFRREILYKVVIGKPVNLDSSYFNPKSNSPVINLDNYFDANRGGDSYIIDNHDVSISCFKGRKKDSNKCSVMIFNLDDEIVNYMRVNAGKDLVCAVFIGDNVSKLKRLFLGTLKLMEDDFSDNDRMTKLTITEGSTNIGQAFTARSYPRNTLYQTVIDDLVSDIKIVSGIKSNITGSFRRPTSFYGNTFDILWKLGVELGFTPVIDNNSITVIKNDEGDRVDAAYLTFETGLLTVNNLVKDQSSTAGEPEQNSQGVSFRALADASITPEASVYINDNGFDAAYKIDNVTFSCSTKGSDWVVSAEAYKTDKYILGT